METKTMSVKEALAYLHRPKDEKPAKLWIKAWGKSPDGYVNTGVYCSSQDSYLWELAS